MTNAVNSKGKHAILDDLCNHIVRGDVWETMIKMSAHKDILDENYLLEYCIYKYSNFNGGKEILEFFLKKWDWTIPKLKSLLDTEKNPTNKALIVGLIDDIECGKVRLD